MNAPCIPQPCPPFPPFPPFPANPSVGDRFGSWVWNGTQWIVSSVGGLVLNIQTWNVAGSYQYIPSPGLMYAQIEAVGGGGGGGIAAGGIPTGGSSPGWAMGGGGGSGGTYSRSVLPATLLTGGVNVVVGPGGLGTTTVGQEQQGGQGGTTSVGSLVIAAGGWGGGSNCFNAASVGTEGLDPAYGQGADPGLELGQPPPPGHVQVNNVGQFTGYGNAGTEGSTNYFDPAQGASGQSIVWGGAGGGTYFSGTWASNSEAGGANNGRDGHLNGVGGGGGASAYAGTQGNGGNGADGCVLITEYCMLPVTNAQDCCGDQGMARVAITGCGPGWGGADWGGGPWPMPVGQR